MITLAALMRGLQEEEWGNVSGEDKGRTRDQLGNYFSNLGKRCW